MEKSRTIATAFNDLTTSIQREFSTRPWDWQAAVLTIILVQVAATRLAISEWVPFLSVVERVSFLAVVLGLIIGYSSFTRRQTIWIGVEYGILLIPMLLLVVVERTDSLYWDLRELLVRLFDSFSMFAQNQPVYDTVFFVTLTSLGFWIIGLHAGYQFARHRNFLYIVIPSGLVMLIVQMYDPFVPLRAWGLAFYIFIALVMLGRLNFLNNKTNWKIKHVFITIDTGWDMSRSAMTFAAIAVFIAWALPSVITNVKPMSRAWREFINPVTERLSDAVSALESQYGVSSSGNFYNSALSLGANAPTSDTPVFFVKVDRVEVAPVRYYWRGRVYDQYIDGQWSSTDERRQNFDPESDELQPIDSAARNEASFTVTMNFPKQELMYAPSEITWVNHESQLVTSPVDDSTREVIAWLADPGLLAGNSYEVRTMIANPSVQELRAAGSEYPQWVTDRYLQVPQGITQQLQFLAEHITGINDTPYAYDKAQAITAYLRNEIQYTSKLTESPPSFEDPVVWVLFEYKKGFCMYYASAEVLMLRTLGIPARMAVGFAEGEFDLQRDRYTVARLDSHAWPEVYFPGIGWVEFEPTGNQDPLDRPRQQVDNTPDDSQPAAGPNSNNIPLELPGSDPTLLEDANIPAPTTTNPLTRFVYPTLLIGFLAIVFFFSQRYSLVDRLPVYLAGRYTKNGRQPPDWLARWSKWANLASIERSFHIIDLSLHWLHDPQPAHSTPLERANTLKKLLPSVQEEITTLTMEHEAALFTSHTGNVARARRAGLKILMETWRTRIFNYKEAINRRLN